MKYESAFNAMDGILRNEAEWSSSVMERVQRHGRRALISPPRSTVSRLACPESLISRSNL